MQYKTTREFLVQFGLDSVAELPNLNELEELSRAALGEEFEEQAQPNLLDAKELVAGNAMDSEPDSVADEQSREQQ